LSTQLFSAIVRAIHNGDPSGALGAVKTNPMIGKCLENKPLMEGRETILRRIYLNAKVGGHGNVADWQLLWDQLVPHTIGLDTPGVDGDNMLMMAANWLDNHAVKLLLESGVNINFQRKHDGQTALMLAISAVASHQENINLMLDAGSDLLLRNIAGERAVDVLARIGENSSKRYPKDETPLARMTALTQAQEMEQDTARPGERQAPRIRL
jgi:ankyrin repeat protein